MADDPLAQHRPNVGVVLFNPGGLVWLGRRVNTPGPYNWQLPQGGVDAGEDWASAALRELFSVAANAKLELVVPANGPITTLLGISGLDKVATVTFVD